MSKLIIPENLAISESGFLFLQGTGETFTLNQVGKDIVDLIKSKSSEEEVINEIVELYDIDKSTVQKDLGDFIAQLKHFSILKEI
jgi:hypothetical protein